MQYPDREEGVIQKGKSVEITGSCLCQRLKFVIKGKLKNAVFCHCPMCRKAQGTAFTSNATCRESDFQWISDTDCLKKYESSKGFFRCFCSNCGSPILKYNLKTPGVYRIRLGVLNDRIDIKPEAHIHLLNKANWYSFDDKVKKYETSVSEGKLIKEI